MTNTIRSEEDLLLLFKSNNAKQITAQGLRDFVVSIYDAVGEGGGGGGTPAEPNNSIQFNADGGFGGSDGLKTDGTYLVLGSTSEATGNNSVAFGHDNTASGENAVAFGKYNTASGENATAFGYYNTASGSRSHAEGDSCRAIGHGSHAEGQNSYAHGYKSHAEGASSKTYGTYSHAEGRNTETFGEQTHAEGKYCQAINHSSHAEGFGTKSIGEFSHTEGFNCQAGYGGLDATIISTEIGHSLSINGDVTSSFINSSIVFMWDFIISGDSNIFSMSAEISNVMYDDGEDITTFDIDQDLEDRTACKCAVSAATAAHAEGFGTHAYGYASHSEGSNTEAIGSSSHAEGNSTSAIGHYSHAEGENNEAHGYSSHAEGYSGKAYGRNSHSEGEGCQAFGYSSHVEGSYSKAIGDVSHAEGSNTQAIHRFSHTEGNNSRAISAYSHAEGHHTRTGTLGNACTIAGTEDGYLITVEGDITDGLVDGNPIFFWDLTGGVQNEVFSLQANVSNVAYDGGDDITTFNIEAVVLGDRTEGMCTANYGIGAHAEGAYTVSSGYGSHAEGYRTIASVQAAHAEGQYTTASGPYAHAEGGQTVASGRASHAEGEWSVASLIGQHASSSGRFQAIADAQYTRYAMRAEITSADATNFVEMVVPEKFDGFTDEKMYACTVTIAGRQDTGANHGMYKRMVVLHRTAGTVALAGAVQTIGTDIETDATWDVQLTADNTAKGLKVEVKGNSQNIRWVALIEAIEIGFFEPTP